MAARAIRPSRKVAYAGILTREPIGTSLFHPLAEQRFVVVSGHVSQPQHGSRPPMRRPYNAHGANRRRVCLGRCPWQSSGSASATRGNGEYFLLPGGQDMRTMSGRLWRQTIKWRPSVCKKLLRVRPYTVRRTRIGWRRVPPLQRVQEGDQGRALLGVQLSKTMGSFTRFTFMTLNGTL